MDSCAAANVCNRDHFPLSVLNTSENRPEHGQEYSCADNGRIFIEGEKKTSVVTGEGERLDIKWQLTQVGRPLLAVSKLSEAGYSTSLRDDGGIIFNKNTGKTIKVHLRNSIYVIDIWIPLKKQPSGGTFSRPR